MPMLTSVMEAPVDKVPQALVAVTVAVIHFCDFGTLTSHSKQFLFVAIQEKPAYRNLQCCKSA